MGAWELAGFWTQVALIATAVIYALTYPAYVVVVMNVNIVHTYFYTPTSWGTLFSCRYSSIAWWAMFMSAFRLFMPLAVFTLVLLRRIKGCITLQTLVVAGIFVLDVLVVFLLLFLAIECNKGGTQCNICDDALKCCVPEFGAGNNCPNMGTPCLFNLSPSQLYWNPSFTGAFITNWLYLIADLIIGVLIAIIWYNLLPGPPKGAEAGSFVAQKFQFQMAAGGGGSDPMPSAPPAAEAELEPSKGSYPSTGGGGITRKRLPPATTFTVAAVPSATKFE
jgi:hypothetical protein